MRKVKVERDAPTLCYVKGTVIAYSGEHAPLFDSLIKLGYLSEVEEEKTLDKKILYEVEAVWNDKEQQAKCLSQIAKDHHIKIIKKITKDNEYGLFVIDRILKALSE